jgi:hypothetical protein
MHENVLVVAVSSRGASMEKEALDLSAHFSVTFMQKIVTQVEHLSQALWRKCR